MHDDPQTGSTIAALRAALQSNLHKRIAIESSCLITLSIILGLEENPPTKLPDIQRNSLLSLSLFLESLIFVGHTLSTIIGFKRDSQLESCQKELLSL